MTTTDPTIPKIFPNQGPGKRATIAAWWTLTDDKDPHHHVIACCKAIEERQSYRKTRNVMWARLYGNQFLNVASRNIYRKPERMQLAQSRVSLNVVKACTDAVTSKIGKAKPAALFLTERGSWSQRKRAEKLTQYVAGVFRDAGVYKNGRLSFRDACIFGTGALKLYTDGANICCDRILSDEIVADDAESIYGQPKTLYQRRYVHREALIAAFGDDEDTAKLIREAPAAEDVDGPDRSEQSDMLYVVEGWHLPSSKDADDGKHVVAISNATLEWKPYTKNYFPIILFYWTPPVVGVYGSGIPEELAGIQFEVNKLLRDVQTAQHLAGSVQVWIENSTQVMKPITNEIGAQYRYTGNAPTFFTPSPMNSQIYGHIWDLYRRAFEIVGVSELSATLKKPAGLESRAALREYSDIETDRFATVAQAYEEYYMKAAEIVVDLSRDLYKEKKKPSTKIRGRRFIETIEWRDVDLDEDAYVMDNFPTSALPGTPSGKIDRITDLMEQGLIDRRYALALLDFPDLEQVVSLETASLDVITMMLDAIVDDGEYNPPEPFMDLQLALHLAQATYLKARQEDVPPDRLEMLIRFMNQTLMLLTASQPQQPPVQQPAGLTPPTQTQPVPSVPVTPNAPPPAGAAPPPVMSPTANGALPI